MTHEPPPKAFHRVSGAGRGDRHPQRSGEWNLGVGQGQSFAVGKAVTGTCSVLKGGLESGPHK